MNLNHLVYRSSKTTIFSFALAGLLVLTIVSSCKKYSCYTYGIRGLAISSSNTLTETDAEVTRYSPDGTFSNLLEAYTVSLNGPASILFVNFPVSGKDAWKYDWQIMLRPSGKLYKVKNLKAENDESIAHCVNPVHFTLNDSAMVTHTAITAYSDTQTMYLNVDY